MLERSLYLLRRALRNFRQSPVLCTAAVGTVAVSLTILALFGIVVLNIQQLTRHWSAQVQVVAYLDTPPGEARLEELRRVIGAQPQVSGLRYVGPEQALERFRRRLGDDASLLAGVDPGVLPASLEIELRPEDRNRAGIESLVGHLRRQSGLSDLRYGQDWLHRFEAFLGLLRAGFLVLGGFLLFATLFIVANTIRLTLFARKEEIQVMALVGGTPWFIRTPFVIEGALQGVIGGLLAVGGAALLFHGFLQHGLGTLLLATGLEGIRFLPGSYQAALVGAGGLVGVFGSLISLGQLTRE